MNLLNTIRFDTYNELDVTVRTRLRKDSTTAPDFDPSARFALQLLDRLPDICARHGEPAVEFVDKGFAFRSHEPERSSTGIRWIQRTVGYEIRFLLRVMYRAATMRRTDVSPPSSILEGEWPVCSKCLLARRIWQYIGHAIVLAGIGLLIAVLIGTQISTSDHLPVPLGLALFPGWFPCGLVVATLLYQHSANLVLFRPITNHDKVWIRTHPGFADAFESDGTTSEAR